MFLESIRLVTLNDIIERKLNGQLQNEVGKNGRAKNYVNLLEDLINELHFS